ncbi:MAG TPA: S8 family serine peptidase [Longimicrobiaceae bacterium]|nr:S8 family serine peptidase [Longimicrobiaceae bacterium]
MLPLFLGSCADRPLPLQPAEDPTASANVAPATLRTTRGDLITGDAEEFAAALNEIGPDGEVLIWIKESGTPRPAADFLLELPSSGKETVALATEHPSTRRRRNIGPPSVRGAAVDAVVRALTEAGAPSPSRMDALPVIVAKLPEGPRVAALRALLRHSNVDYVSAVRTRPVELLAAPVGTNPIDAKHTVHKVPQAWDLTRGSGAKVGILDSGLARSNATGGFHDDGLYFSTHGILPLGFVDDGCSSTSTANNGGCVAWDDGWRDGSYPHGTAMAGLVGQNDNDKGYVGIAPQATTYSMKVRWNTYIHGHCGDNIFGNNGGCMEDDDLIRAINYAASRRLHVLSMSFAGDYSSDVYRALATARNSYGVFLVAGTGNTVGASAKEPASYDVVMGIAGVDVAGNNVYSTAARDVSGFAGGLTLGATCYRETYCDAGSPGYPGETGGTSAATANVAGIVALIRSYHPNESVSQIWNRLVLTAEGPNIVVNAYAAITYTTPLSVYISGPTNVEPYTYGTWSASSTGGTAPYSYTWYRDGAVVGTGATYTGYVEDGGMQLQVNATDAAGGTATRSLWVSTVMEPVDPCGGYQTAAMLPSEPCTIQPVQQ